MTCPKCKNSLRGKAAYCPTCGVVVVKGEPEKSWLQIHYVIARIVLISVTSIVLTYLAYAVSLGEFNLMRWEMPWRGGMVGVCAACIVLSVFFNFLYSTLEDA